MRKVFGHPEFREEVKAMQLHESCKLCLLSLASRYPHCLLDMNEAVLGAQSVPTQGWTSSGLIEYFQRTMPEVLKEQALLVLGVQGNATYLLDRSLDTPAMWVHRPTNKHPLFEEEERLLVYGSISQTA